MGQQLFGKVSTESLKLLDGFSQVDRVPEHDRGNNQAEAICPVLLVFVGSVSQFAETIEKQSPRQDISSLAFVEAGLYAPTQFDVAQKIEHGARSFQPSKLAQRSRDSVLTWVGGEPAKDGGSGHGSLHDRSSKPEKIFPML